MNLLSIHTYIYLMTKISRSMVIIITGNFRGKQFYDPKFNFCGFKFCDPNTLHLDMVHELKFS